MSRELILSQPPEEKFDLLADIDQMQNACKKLMQTKHYQAMGEAGIFAIIQKAKSLKINAIDALGGGLYFTNGKVGMSAEMMNTLIRSHGHSITKDTKSNDNLDMFYKNFNGDEVMTREYVNMCMAKKNWSESKTIIGLQQDLEASLKTYEKWKAKQKRPDVITIVESPSMESASLFDEVR